ncbi:MAG: 50S ribosomal protein L23 [bacterium]|nr:50S ribosomal protein L23 [bacterium]
MSSEVLVSPIITEKTAEQIAVNKYAFFVTEDANKIQIRQFIESRFGAKVEKVNITKSPGKKRRRGRIVGRTSDRKKAIVTLAEGQSIDTVKDLF